MKPQNDPLDFKEIKLPNGEVHSIPELIGRAVTSYAETKVTYNLSRRTRQGKVVVASNTKFKSKYSREDTLWMIDKSAEEIAERYDISKSQAYYIKHYARRCWGL